MVLSDSLGKSIGHAALEIFVTMIPRMARIHLVLLIPRQFGTELISHL